MLYRNDPMARWRPGAFRYEYKTVHICVYIQSTMKIENYNGEDRFVSNPNTKEDQKRTKKNKKKSVDNNPRRKERKRAENVPENRATFLIAGRYFSFSCLRFYCDGQSVLESIENTFGGSSLEREPPPVQFLRCSLSLSFFLSPRRRHYHY